MNNLLNIKECLLDSIKYHGCNKIIIKYVLKTIYELYQIEIEEDYEKEKMGYIHNLDPLNYYLVEEVDRKML